MGIINQLVTQIESLYEEMKSVTLAAGVPPNHYDFVKQADSDLTLEILEFRLQFLQAVKISEYHEFHKVYTLLPAEVWVMYTLLGRKTLNEQKEFNKTSRALRKIWEINYEKANQKSNSSGTTEELV